MDVRKLQQNREQLNGQTRTCLTTGKGSDASEKNDNVNFTTSVNGKFLIMMSAFAICLHSCPY